jgi:hypothetical protein
MTLVLTANIILAVIVFAGIVGMLAAAIRTSRPAHTVRTARPRVPRAYGARAHTYGSFEGMGA